MLLLNVLEAGYLAERRRDQTDRRRHIVQLAPAGGLAMERATLRRLLLRALEAESAPAKA